MAAPAASVLVLGVGNLLLSDEGIGIRVIQRLQELYRFPQQVRFVDGGTLGLDLLYYLEGVERMLIIDAVETGQAPGTLIRLENEQVPAFLSAVISPHQIGVGDMLVAARLRDLYPQQLVLWGVQPGSTEIGLQLSADVGACLEPLSEQIRLELAQWGLVAEPR